MIEGFFMLFFLINHTSDSERNVYFRSSCISHNNLTCSCLKYSIS